MLNISATSLYYLVFTFICENESELLFEFTLNAVLFTLGM